MFEGGSWGQTSTKHNINVCALEHMQAHVCTCMPMIGGRVGKVHHLGVPCCKAVTASELSVSSSSLAWVLDVVKLFRDLVDLGQVWVKKALSGCK